MPPILNIGKPIVVDLGALQRTGPIATIDLARGHATPKDAIMVEDIDTLATLVAMARKLRR